METKLRVFDGYKMIYFDLKSDITIKYGHLYLPEEDIYLDLKHSTIMQYTGLKDKNGKEIYEKDIVKFYNQVEYIIGYIAFDHGVFCLKIYNPDEACYNPWTFRAKEVEVIGNMFENFDLFNLCLKEAKNATK